jgi:ribosomal protein L32
MRSKEPSPSARRQGGVRMSDWIGYLIHCSICEAAGFAKKPETVCPNCIGYAYGTEPEDFLPLGEVQG